jgi:hypothetical protein
VRLVLKNSYCNCDFVFHCYGTSGQILTGNNGFYAVNSAMEGLLGWYMCYHCSEMHGQ